jgi:RNA polymerase sigma factor (TIGR02999 family)
VERRNSIPELLRDSREGRPEALDRLVPLVYDELRLVARRQLRRERPEHTLGTTGLVHEAYLRLVGQSQMDWRDRTHFFAIAARVMRRVLVDYARRRGAQKRGAGQRAASLDELDELGAVVDEQAEMLVALDDALARLSELDERQCRVVECRFFAGFTEDETAEMLGVSARTVRNDWVKARAWLYQELHADLRM